MTSVEGQEPVVMKWVEINTNWATQNAFLPHFGRYRERSWYVWLSLLSFGKEETLDVCIKLLRC